MAHFLVCCRIINFVPRINIATIGDRSDEAGTCALDFSEDMFDYLCLFWSFRLQILLSILVDDQMKVKVTAVVGNVKAAPAGDVSWVCHYCFVVAILRSSLC